MRRLLAAALALVLLLPLSACAKEVQLPAADYFTEIVTVYAQENGNSIQLMYPAVSGYADAEAETRINAAIAEYAMEMYRRENLIADEEGGYEYSAVEAVVMLETEGFLSAYVGGIIASEVSGNTVYFAYTLNCDIRNGVLYTTEELLSDYGKLAKRFADGDFTQHFGYKNLEQQTHLTDMISQYKAEYGIYPDVYFTDGGLGFLIEVVPLLDGYAGYTLPIRQAKSCLNTENPLAAFVAGEHE